MNNPNPNHFAPENVFARDLVRRLRRTARNGVARYRPNGVAVLERAAGDIERLMHEGKTATRLPFDLTNAELVLLTELFVILRLRVPEKAEDAASRLMRDSGVYQTQADSAGLLRELLADTASWPTPGEIPGRGVN